MDIAAPRIAASALPGQFIIIKMEKNSERIPLTIAGADIEKGTINLVVQQVGASTHKLLAMHEGDCLHDIVGPLGKPTEIENFGTVVAMAGGVGTAELLPVISDLLKAGNKVIKGLVKRRQKECDLFNTPIGNNSFNILIIFKIVNFHNSYLH